MLEIFDRHILNLPFFEERHRELAYSLEQWIEESGAPFAHNVSGVVSGDVPSRCLRAGKLLASSGWLDYAVPEVGKNKSTNRDFRAICLIREGLAWCDDILDFVFSIQSLSSSTISHYGSSAQKNRYLPAITKCELFGTFAVTESSSGSDLSSIRLAAKKCGDNYCLNGEKSWISNATIANFHCVLARTSEGKTGFGQSMFIVPEHTKNLHIEKVDLTAPRSIGTLRFDNCIIPKENMIGKEGYGFQYAMEVLSRYRMTVGSTAIGFARRALEEALRWAKRRKVSGGLLFDTQLAQNKLADIKVFLDSASLLVARAAWEYDNNIKGGFNLHSSMAKLFASDGAHKVVDDAMQLMGASGLVSNSIIERLAREIKLLRVYEGTSDIQRFTIANGLK